MVDNRDRSCEPKISKQEVVPILKLMFLFPPKLVDLPGSNCKGLKWAAQKDKDIVGSGLYLVMQVPFMLNV